MYQKVSTELVEPQIIFYQYLYICLDKSRGSGDVDRDDGRLEFLPVTMSELAVAARVWDFV